MTGTMTAAVWLAPMVPTLPLPLAQRVDRLLGSEDPGETQVHALALCEAIIAYAACMRAGVANAVVPKDSRSGLVVGISTFRRAVTSRATTVADFRELLMATADAIEEIEPGHPLGRSELTRPRPAWVARMQLIETLGDRIDERHARGIADGGIVGILDAWVWLVETIEAEPAAAEPPAWLVPLGDLLVEVLNSPLIGEVSLSYPPPEQAPILRLHGLEAEPDADPAEPARYTPGVVCWRFDARVISSCGLLGYWVDEHEFDHVGIVAGQTGTGAYFDYGMGQASPSSLSGGVDWAALGWSEVAAVELRGSVPFGAIASMILIGLLLVVGVGFALWPNLDPEESAPQAAHDPSGEPGQAAEPAPPAEPVVEELVIEAALDPPESDDPSGPGRGDAEADDASDTSDTSDASETDPEVEAATDVPTAALWFESERNLGTCKVSYAGRTRTANLHLNTRQPAGELEFSYRCGEYRGRGSINVKVNRVNGVLFCKKNGSVKVKTVRSNEGRCDR